MSRITSLLTALAVCTTALLVAQAPREEKSWAHQFGTTRPDQATGVVAVDGQVYVVGDVIGALPGQTAQGPNDRNAFIRRYDPDGKELWTRQFGSPAGAHDSATGIAVSGFAIYVAGWTSGVLADQQKVGTQDSAFVRRYNVEGDAVWTRQFGTEARVQALGVAADASGVYVTGSIDCCGFPFPGTLGTSGADAFLRKYDSEGNELWTRQFGTGDSDRATAVAVDGTGVYVIGVTGGAMKVQIGHQDNFLMKFDTDGQEIWRTQFGTSMADEANVIALAPSGVYVGGRTTGSFTGPKADGLWDGYVAQLDRNGMLQWARQFGGKDANGNGRDADVVLGLATGLTAVLVTGAADGALPGQKWVGLQDAFYRTYDFAGNEISTVEFGNGGNDYGAAASADARGFYVAGSKNGGALGLPPVGDNDAFIMKLANRPLDKDVEQPGPAPRRGGPPVPVPPGGRGGRRGGQ